MPCATVFRIICVDFDQLGLEDEVIGKKQSGKSFVESSIRHYLIVVLGFPLYVYGVLWNYLRLKYRLQLPGR